MLQSGCSRIFTCIGWMTLTYLIRYAAAHVEVISCNADADCTTLEFPAYCHISKIGLWCEPIRGKACSSDSDCGSHGSCFMPNDALTQGMCGACMNDTDCTAETDRNVCYRESRLDYLGLCAGCKLDTDCASGQYCNDGRKPIEIGGVPVNPFEDFAMEHDFSALPFDPTNNGPHTENVDPFAAMNTREHNRRLQQANVHHANVGNSHIPAVNRGRPYMYPLPPKRNNRIKCTGWPSNTCKEKKSSRSCCEKPSECTSGICINGFCIA